MDRYNKRYNKIINLLIFIINIALKISLISLTGCNQDPNKIALRANMHKKLHYNHDFIITSYARVKNKTDISKPLIIYIEGDGQAWVNKYRLSSNPTPRDLLTLKLAAIDQNPNVIYIARPCQFTPLNLDKNCSPKYWSEARYSNEVINAINQVINYFQKSLFNQNILKNTRNTDKQKIHLIGYSGGATIAGIIASRRQDITSLRTIAGNLDHDAVSDFHKTTKLKQSLNLIDFTNNISHIPQMHYIGEKDQIIPIKIVQTFVEKVNSYKNINCANYRIFNHLDHYHGWESVWRQVVEQIPTCN